MLDFMQIDSENVFMQNRRKSQNRAGGRGTRAAGGSGSVGFRSVREDFGLTQPLMARVLGVSVRKLSELETSARAARPETKRRLTEVRRLRAALAEIMDPDDLGAWMEEPNPAFGGATPLQLIERGEIDLLWQMIYAVRGGHPV